MFILVVSRFVAFLMFLHIAKEVFAAQAGQVMKALKGTSGVNSGAARRAKMGCMYSSVHSLSVCLALRMKVLRCRLIRRLC